MNSSNPATEEERPPVFERWKGWYWLVMGVLAVQVIVYAWITYSYR